MKRDGGAGLARGQVLLPACVKTPRVSEINLNHQEPAEHNGHVPGDAKNSDVRQLYAPTVDEFLFSRA